jgi:CHAD domain-containing protein
MRDYARQQTVLLIGRLTVALERAARTGDPDAIHDVRVAMRRLSRCLRVFAPFYPAGPAKKIRRRIADLLAVAGAARDCDVAIELVARAGVARRNAMVTQIAHRRQKMGRALLLEIRRWKRHNFVGEWRERLELER